MSSTVLTTEQIKAKGITAADVRRMVRGSEARCNSYLRQVMRNGGKCSAEFQRAWDAECARWDHAKATLAVLIAA